MAENENQERTEPTLTPIELAARYYVLRTERQIRNGGTANRATGSADDSQLSVSGGLEGSQIVKPRSDLVEDEKRDRSGHSNVADKPPDSV